MSSGRAAEPPLAACTDCVRRSWLLAELSGPLEFLGRDRGRLLDALALSDGALIDAVAGRRASELRQRHAAFGAQGRDEGLLAGAVCEHTSRRPGLGGPLAPALLNVAGDPRALSRPAVAIVGAQRASDYGREIAHCLARALTACDVTVIAPICDGIASAALTGAASADGGRALAVCGAGLAARLPARAQALREQLRTRGCVVSELPSDCAPRRWMQVASGRTVAALATVTVLVEGNDGAASLAKERGDVLAAVPGRVTSELARRPHTLLRDGATLVRGAEDVLELLGERAPAAEHARPRRHARGLRPRLRDTLAQLDAGRDTTAALLADGRDPGEVLADLGELELLGLIRRGDGGRYLLRARDR